MNAIEAYLLARAYTNQALEGAGALKGAACQIKSITSITGGHRVTFEWEDDEGESSTETMDVMDGTNGTDGDDGVGIASITYKETDVSGNYVYTVTLTDSNSYDITCPKGPQGSTGQTGATGNGIASIEKTSTVGLVDTYTITYTNGTTSTFTVTNGQDGENEFIGTLAEWNALTTAQQKEYDTYQITDDYTEGKYIYLPTIYSEEEREVGVWKDGKPLYQKIMNFDFTVNTNMWALFDDSVSYDTLVGVIPKMKALTASEEQLMLYGDSDTSPRWCLMNDHKLYYYVTNQPRKGYVILQYTKTTDTAGSGTWTPTGQYAKHYSTDEQVIGTWIDGSTLYERTITGFSLTLQSGVAKDTEVDISYVSKLISVDALGNDDISVLPVAGYKINNTLQMLGFMNGNVINKAVIQYTKTA